jgi:hypothetical protein
VRAPRRRSSGRQKHAERLLGVFIYIDFGQIKKVAFRLSKANLRSIAWQIK